MSRVNELKKLGGFNVNYVAECCVATRAGIVLEDNKLYANAVGQTIGTTCNSTYDSMRYKSGAPKAAPAPHEPALKKRRPNDGGAAALAMMERVTELETENNALRVEIKSAKHAMRAMRALQNDETSRFH